MNAKDIEHMLTMVQEEARGLSKWELDFVASVADQFAATKSLSPRQTEVLERIYAEKTH